MSVLQIHGSRINREISAAEVEKIKNADTFEQTSSGWEKAWDKIADIFCGTNKEAAKKHLFNLFHSPAEAHGYITGKDGGCEAYLTEFNALKALAPVHLQKLFEETHLPEGTRLTIPDFSKPGTVLKTVMLSGFWAGLEQKPAPMMAQHKTGIEIERGDSNLTEVTTLLHHQY